MRGAARLSLGLAATLALAGAVRAQSYEAFDAAGAATAAERLVLCDTTVFLSRRPDLNAQRIVAPRQDGMAALLLPPQFLAGGQMYADRDARLMDKLIVQHQATVREIAQAQATRGRAMIDLYRTSRHIDHPFTVHQENICRAFARAYGVHGS